MLSLPFGPSTTLLLLTAGLLLVTVEFNRPGLILPGAAGLLATLVAVASAAKRPHAPLVLPLLAVAAVAFARDARRPHPLLVATGALSLVAAYGIEAAPARAAASLALALGCAALVAVTTAILARIAHRARVNKGLD